MFENKGSTSISISTGTIIRVVLIGLGVFLMWYLRDLVLVVLTAIVIASFMGSAVPHIQKLGFSRIFGIVFLYFISLLAFAAMFYLFAPLLVTEIYNFSTFISIISRTMLSPEQKTWSARSEATFQWLHC